MALDASHLIVAKLGAWLIQGDTCRMGFDPQRRRVTRRSDIWFVVSAIIVALVLLTWAFVG
jgi:hypothetical protein